MKASFGCGAAALATIASIALLACSGGGGSGSGSSGNGAPTVSSITLDPSTPGMLVGGKLQLTAVATYTDGSTSENSTDMSWSSSNTAVAEVSGGNVTAKGAGTADITVSLGGAAGHATVTVQALANMTVLYFGTSSSSTQYLPPGVSVDSSAQHIIRYAPALGLADVVASNASYSYAVSYMHPYAVDDRLFTITDSSPGTAVGDEDIMELDPHDDHRLHSYPGIRLGDDAWCCGAVVGGAYYYKSAQRYDLFKGNVGGDFLVFDLTSHTRTKLLTNGDADLSGYRALTSSRGNLYDGKWSAGTDTIEVDVVKRDLATGKIVPSAAWHWTFTTTGPTKGPVLAFDGAADVAYAAFLDTTSKELDVFQLPFTGGAPTAVLAQSVPDLGDIAVARFSNGQLAVGDYKGTVFLLDLATGSSSVVELGVDYYALQLLHLTE